MSGSLLRLLDPGDWIAVKPKLDPAAPSLRLDYAPSRGEVKLRFWAGSIVLAIAAAVVYWLRDEGLLTLILISGFGLFGFLNLIYGFLQSGYTLTLAITERSVAFDSRTRFGRKFWHEPLAGYCGVLLRESESADRGIANMDDSKTFHIVELVHADPAKTVALYVKEGNPPPRDVQQAFARRFRLQELEPEGTVDLKRPAVDPGPSPSGVRVEQRDGTTRLIVEPGRAGRSLAWIVWLLLPLAASALVYQIDRTFAWIAGGMAALFVLMVLGVGALVSRKQETGGIAICIDAQRVWIDHPGRRNDAVERLMRNSVSRLARRPLPGWPPQASGVTLPAVERIRVDNYTDLESSGPGHHARLLIEGASGRIEYLGAPFDRKKLEWIRDYLCFRLASRK